MDCWGGGLWDVDAGRLFLGALRNSVRDRHAVALALAGNRRALEFDFLISNEECASGSPTFITLTAA